MGKIIGIDLGTTNSCVAIIEGSKPKVLENSEGDRTTPSIVAYVKNGEVLVGQPAKRQSITNPKNTLFAIKRLIGRKFNDKEIKKDIDIMPYNIVSSENGDAWIKINDKKIAPPQISAEILKKMKKTAEDYLGETIKEAVITVPAYFNDAQRQATKDAGRIAGLEVKRIINEPTAAALAYGLDKKTGNTIVAVYDLGGGTFDISIIEIDEVDGEKTFEVLSTNGDTHLGGEDFDSKLINYFVNEFKKEYNINLKNDPLAMQRLKDSSEKVKIELSSSQQTEINLPYITADSSGPKHMTYKITKSKFESLVEELINKTMNPVELALKDANLSIDKINDIILVGGQTRMPLVQKKVTEFFKKDVKKDINPDEAVAIGAAIQGGVLSGSVKDLLLLDVTPLSLGIETMGGVMTTLISKNTTIPTKHSQIFSTAEDNQSAVTIHILQGERKRSIDNKSLGQFNLDGIAPAMRGIPQIEVKFDIDSDGILHVSAKDKNSGKEQKITIQSSSGLNESEIKKMIQEAEDNAEIDKKFEELIQIKNQGDQILHSTKKQLSEVKNKMTDDEIKNIEKSIDDLEESMKHDNKDDIENNIKSLIQVSSKIIDLMQKSNDNEKNNDNSSNSCDNNETTIDKNKENEEASDAEFEEIKDK